MRRKINPARWAALKNRIKQGLLAFIGSLAILGATAIRVADVRNVKLNAVKAVKLAAASSAVAGAVWSLFPRASDPLATTVDAIKAEIHTVTRMAASAAISEVNVVPAASVMSKAASPSYPSYSRWATPAAPSVRATTSPSATHSLSKSIGLDDRDFDDDLYLPGRISS